jgi:hypothetical protein
LDVVALEQVEFEKKSAGTALLAKFLVPAESPVQDRAIDRIAAGVDLVKSWEGVEEQIRAGPNNSSVRETTAFSKSARR